MAADAFKVGLRSNYTHEEEVEEEEVEEEEHVSSLILCNFFSSECFKCTQSYTISAFNGTDGTKAI